MSAPRRSREIDQSTQRYLESLVGKNGREIWNLLDKIGPNLKRNRIPMEVYYYDKIITDKGDVLRRWENDFSLLYQGAAQTSQFDNEFLNQVNKVNIH